MGNDAKQNGGFTRPSSWRSQIRWWWGLGFEANSFPWRGDYGNQCNWMATLITLWYSWISEQWLILHAPFTFLSHPELSKCNQSRWPSNCTGFHGHDVLKNSSLSLGHCVQQNVLLHWDSWKRFSGCVSETTLRDRFCHVKTDEKVIPPPPAKTKPRIVSMVPVKNCCEATEAWLIALSRV